MNSDLGARTALEFFDGLHSAFETASRKGGCDERFFQLGSFTLRLCFAGPALAAQITPALNHLATVPTGNPDLTVLLWDDVTTETILPTFPWQTQPTREQFATVQALNTRRFFVTFNEYGGILNAFDATTRTALFWLRDGQHVPTHETATPLRNLLHWFLMHNDAHFIHSGAVGTPAGGVLLAGKAGSGKSTTAVACLESELQYAADDYSMLSAEPEPHVYSLYATAKLHGHTLARVAHVKATVVNPHELDEKATVLLYPAWQEKLLYHFPLRAILLPRVTGARDTKLVPATTAASIRALTLSTVLILPRTDAVTVQKLNHLIARVPAYHLELGTDMTQIPNIIMNYLEHASN